MTYIAEVWDYEKDQEKIKKLCDFLFQAKKIIIVNNEKKDDSIFIISQNVERDMPQAIKVARFLNTEE